MSVASKYSKMLSFTLFVIVFSLLAVRVINYLNFWKKRNVTFTRSWPLDGDLKDVILRKRNVADAVEESYRRFPKKRYYGTFMFTMPCLVVTDIDLIKKITVKDFGYFVDHISSVNSDLEPLFSKNLFELRGQKWRDMRNTLSPLFTGNKIRMMFQLVSDCAKQFNNHFLGENGEIIEIEAKDLMSRISTDIIATTAFGVQCNSLKEDNEFYKIGQIITEKNLSSFFKVMMQMVFPKISKILGVHLIPKEATKFFEKVIKETLEQREEMNIIRPDMIHILMEARKSKQPEHDTHDIPGTGFASVEEIKIAGEQSVAKEEITVEDIVAQGFLFFIGGFEIVSILLAHLCHELAVNPDVQEKLQREVDLGFEANEGDYESLVNMKYLDMVVSETLRKWPLNVLLNRECIKDYKIEASEVHGEPEVKIEKGTGIFIPVYAIHHDPKYYPEPAKFDPERFNDENKQKINPYTYMPFGIGPRNCIGSRVALLEAKVIIVYILSKFEIVVVEKTQIPLVPSLKKPGLSPDRFWLGLKKRKFTP